MKWQLACILGIALFFAYSLGIDEIDLLQENRGLEMGEKPISSAVHQLNIVEIINDPYAHFRKGTHYEIQKILRDNAKFSFHEISLKQLDSIRNYSIQFEQTINHFMLGLISYGHLRNSAPQKACDIIKNTALVAKTDLGSPKLALEILRLAQLSKCNAIANTIDSLQFFIVNDLELSKLLGITWTDKSHDDKKIYQDELFKAIEKYPHSSLISKAMISICSIFYWFNDYANTKKWGERALKKYPELAKWGPLQDQLQFARNHVWKKRALNTFIFIYVICAVILILRGFQSGWQIDYKWLLKKTIFIVPVFLLLSWVIFKWDSAASVAPSQTLTTFTVLPKQSIFPPIVPLSIMDTTYMPNAFLVLLIGCAPVLFNLLYVAFKKEFSRLRLGFITVIIMATSWTHFFLIKGYDQEMMPEIMFTKSRIFLNADLDTLMLKHPKSLNKKKNQVLY